MNQNLDVTEGVGVRDGGTNSIDAGQYGGAEFVFTSESVTEGHPDKVCDLIADSVLDAYLTEDPHSRVACEVLVKRDQVVLAGEISSTASVDACAVARTAIALIGYTDPSEPFNAPGVKITSLIFEQVGEIKRSVDQARDGSRGHGAGDQGLMFGYATDETPELMPLPILIAHRLAQRLAQVRHEGRVSWLRPDGKTQASVQYNDGRPVAVKRIVVSAQHTREVGQEELRTFVETEVVPQALASWNCEDMEVSVNTSGSFVEGGPSADADVTGRKIIVDTYGGFARHGGGAFSGKDPTKVDRSGAYFCRYVARQIVRAGLARRAEVQVSYAIGQAKPVSVMVETFGTGNAKRAASFVTERFDFRPSAMIEFLNLRRPIYAKTTNYGHFGKPDLPWEKDKA